MGTRIRIRRSSVPSNRPSLSQLQTGELALNTYDGRLFAIRDEQTALGIGSTVTLLTPWTENIGGGIYYADSSVGIGTTVPTSTLHVVGNSRFDNNLDIGGNLKVEGTTDFIGVVTFRGGTLNLGDSDSDDIFVGGEFSSGLNPTANLALDLGTPTKQWAELHAGSVILSGISTFNQLVDFNHSVNITGVTTHRDDVHLLNNVQLNLGALKDLSLYNTGNASYIVDSGAGDLFIRGNAAIRLQDALGNENYAVFNVDGAAELFYDAKKKFATTEQGVGIAGSITVDNDLLVTGVSTFVGQVNFDNTDFDGQSTFDDINVSGVSTFASHVDLNSDLDVDGKTNLDDLSVSGVSTFAKFVDIESNLNVDGTAEIDNLNVSGITTTNTLLFNNYLKGGNNDKIYLGNDNDLIIYHSGSQGFIDNNRSHLYIRNNVDDDDGGNIYIQAKSGEASISIFDDAGVYLYYNGSTRLYTTNSGATVNGNLTINNDVTVGDDLIVSDFLDVQGGAEIDKGVLLRDQLYVQGNLRALGVSTLGNYTFRNDVIEGPAELIIDPAGIDNNTGLVRIKGDLYVDGDQFVVSSSTIELADHVVGIASTTSSDILTDGAGIGIGGASVRKTFTYNQSSDALKSSEHLDVALNKTYKINGTEVLRAGQLTIGNAVITGVSTLATVNGTNLTYTTADIDTAYVTTGIVTTLQGTDVTYQNLYGVTGIVTTLQGTDVFYTNGNFTSVDVDNAYVTTGIVTTLQGTDVTYQNLYGVTGVVTTLQGTDASYTNAYVNTGVVTALSVPSNGTLDVDGKTDLDDLNVAGVATFTAGSNGDTKIGFGNTALIVEGDARITGTLAIGTSSVTIDGDNNLINVGAALTIDGTNNVIHLGDDVTIDNTGLSVAGISSITATTIFGDIDGELNTPGNSHYVATTGDDNHTGNNINQPYRTLVKALSVASDGDVIHIAAGDYAEICPLTVPAGVTIKGNGMRAVTIRPTDATKTENVFLLNNLSTIEDITIKGSYYRSAGDTGYAFAYQPGIAITNRSPYIQRVTVLNRGSNVTADDPYGYDTADSPPTSYVAGRGAKVDGSLVDSESLEAGMLFNEVTFFTPNSKGVILTNGARAEYLNCFHYFASEAIVGESGSVGIASTAGSRLNVVGVTTTLSANDVVKQFDGGGNVVAIGTVKTFDSPYIVLTEKGSGIFTAIGAGSTNDVRFYDSDGTTQRGYADRVAFADYTMFGAELRSVGCAVEYGSKGVVADGDGVNMRLFALNFNHVGSGKDFSNDPTKAIQANETTELNNGEVSYVSIDHKGDFRVGESFYVNQETGSVSFAATSVNLEVTGNMDVTDGVDTSTLTPTSLSVGNLQLAANTFSSTAGDIVIDPANNSETIIQGDLSVIGILTASIISVDALQTGDSSIAIDDTGSNGTIRFNTDGSEAFRVDSSQRIGIGTNNPDRTLTVEGDFDTYGQTQHYGDLRVTGISTFEGVSEFESNVTLNSDSAKLILGTDDDLQLYHNGNVSYIDNNDGNLYIRNNVNNDDGGDIYIQAKVGENSIICADDSSVNLYFNGSSRFSTRNYGALLYGTLYVNTIDGHAGIEVATAGVSTLPTLVGTNLTYDSADIDNAYVTTGIVTTLQGTDATYANLYGVVGVVTTISGTDVNYTNANLTSADIDNAYVTTGIVTTLQGTDATYTNLYGVAGVVTSIAGSNLNYTQGILDNGYVVTGIVTTLQGTDITYTNAYATTGVVTTISGTDVNYTNANLTSADIDNAYVTTGIVTTLQGTDATYANLYGVAGVVTTISGTDANYTNANLSSADIDNAYVTTGIVTTLQGTDATYTNLYGVAGVVTSIAGSNLNYTQGVLDNGYVVTGIVTTLQGTDVTYDNAYVTTGVVTTIQGTDASYTNVYANAGVVTSLSIPANGTFDVDGKTDLDDLSVAGVATFTNSSGTALLVTGNAKIVGVLTVGSSSVEIDGLTDEIHVGSATTIHTGGYQIGNSDIHSSGATLEHSNVLGVSTVGVELSAGGVVTANTGGLNVAGVTTATAFHTGAEGSAIRVTSNTISGPATLNIDPAGVGDNTGTVVIKGDLQVDGTQTIVNSTAVTIDDKNIILASGAANDAAADGGGITLESGDGNKTINWVDSTDAWTFSEHINLASTKTYKIAGTDVLSADTLGSGVLNSSLTSVGTITTGTWQGTAIANEYLANSSISIGGVSLSLGGTDETPALDLQDATNYPYASLTGVTTSIVGDTTPQLGGNLDLNSSDITGTGDVNITGSVTASAAINSNTDVQINGTSVLTSASDEAVALAIALG